MSALIGTLVGASRTAQAQPLGSRVPEVDRVAVCIVTDSHGVNFIPSEKRDGIAIERARSNLTPDAPPRTNLHGEWGLSMYAESKRGNETRNILVDFGYTPETLLNNISILKIDPAGFDALVLSHGHYDHFGGMVGFLAANKGKLRAKLPFFVGGEDCFCVRETVPGGQFGALDRKAIMDADLALMMAEGSSVVADHAFTTGKIALSTFEKPLQPSKEKIGTIGGFGCFPDKVSPAKNTGNFILDDFEHEIGTNFLVKGNGLVVLTSCSHRGVINTIKQAQAASGVQKVHAVIGGFHIVPPLGDDYSRHVIVALKEINPDFLIPGHCSGDRFCEIARNEFGDKVIHSEVGTRFVFGA